MLRLALLPLPPSLLLAEVNSMGWQSSVTWPAESIAGSGLALLHVWGDGEGMRGVRDAEGEGAARGAQWRGREGGCSAWWLAATSAGSGHGFLRSEVEGGSSRQVHRRRRRRLGSCLLPAGERGKSSNQCTALNLHSTRTQPALNLVQRCKGHLHVGEQLEKQATLPLTLNLSITGLRAGLNCQAYNPQPLEMQSLQPKTTHVLTVSQEGREMPSSRVLLLMSSTCEADARGTISHAYRS